MRLRGLFVVGLIPGGTAICGAVLTFGAAPAAAQTPFGDPMAIPTRGVPSAWPWRDHASAQQVIHAEALPDLGLDHGIVEDRLAGFL